MPASRPRLQLLVRPTGPMLRLLRQIARAPASGGRPRNQGRSLGYAATLNGLITRRLVEEVEREGKKVYVPTAAGRRELELIGVGMATSQPKAPRGS